MICDRDTCTKKYIDTRISEQNHYITDEDEFIKNLKHEKCKIIQLVRRQMHNFHDTQYKLSLTINELQRSLKLKSQDILHSTSQEALNVNEDINKNMHVIPRALFARDLGLARQAWLIRTLKKIRQRICAVVLVAGIILLISLIYGIYFRTYVCNNRKSCITSLRYTHTKHTLF